MSGLDPNRSLFEVSVERTRRRRSELKAGVAAEAIVPPNDLQPELIVTMWRLERLRPPKINTRKVTPEHVAGVMDAMAKLGVVSPLLVAVDADGQAAEIIDGVIRLEAARALGMEEIACIALTLPSSKRKALRLRLNREQEKGTWDLVRLGEVLVELNVLEIDLSITGFTVSEIDLAMTGAGEVLGRAEKPLPLVPNAPVTQLGDLFALGENRLICGDALNPETYVQLLGTVKARLIVSDPPYNQPAARIGGRGKIRHEDFAQAAGEMSEEAFEVFCRGFLALMVVSAVPGALAYVFMDWMHLWTLLSAARAEGLIQKNLIVWDKGHGGMGGLYRSAHELIPLFAVPGAPSIDNVQLGRFGRDRQNIFRYPGANSRGSSARAQLENHPTPKNVECIADIMLDASAPGDAVLDSFIGSGTLFIATERAKRVGYGIELSPAYCDVAIKRWEQETGQVARLVATGETFAELADRRGAEAATKPTPADAVARPEEPAGPFTSLTGEA